MSPLSPELCAAVRDNDAAAIARAVHEGEPVDGVDFDGRTALHLAVATNSLDAARALLEHGADPNALDRFGLAPLFRAVFDDRVAMIELLRAAGAHALLRGPVSTPRAAAHPCFYDLALQLQDTVTELDDTVAM